MTLIDLSALHVALGAPEPLEQGSITVDYWAGSREYVGVEGSSVLFPRQIRVDIVAGQPLEALDLAPTDASRCVKWVIRDESGGTTRTLTRYTTIPPTGPIAFGDLPVVDPFTFVPVAPDAIAGWEAATAQITADMAVQVSTAEGHATAAAGSASQAAGSATDAASSATQAQGSATAAATSAADADADRVAAQQAKTDAEAARDASLAGQFAGTLISSPTDLNTLTTPGVYRFTVTSAASSPNIPQPDLGDLTVFQADTYRLQRFVPVRQKNEARVEYMRHFNGAAWGAWRVFRSSRFDQTAGRAIYTWDDLNGREQLIYGDTGWRAVANWDANGVFSVGSLPAGWKPRAGLAGSVFVRRLGSRVHVRLTHIEVAVAATNDRIWTATAGFEPDSVNALVPIMMNGTKATAIQPNLARAALQTYPAGDYIYQSEISYTTGQTWPTSLPGVANGSIPNA